MGAYRHYKAFCSKCRKKGQHWSNLDNNGHYKNVNWFNVSPIRRKESGAVLMECNGCKHQYWTQSRIAQRMAK